MPEVIIKKKDDICNGKMPNQRYMLNKDYPSELL